MHCVQIMNKNKMFVNSTGWMTAKLILFMSSYLEFIIIVVDCQNQKV